MTFYDNGTHKEVMGNGDTVIKFVNGDVKTTKSDGTVVYYYQANGTYHSTMADGTEVYEFLESNQIEYHYPDNRKVIVYGDGTRKVIAADGSSEVTFGDGVVVREVVGEGAHVNA